MLHVRLGCNLCTHRFFITCKTPRLQIYHNKYALIDYSAMINETTCISIVIFRALLALLPRISLKLAHNFVDSNALLKDVLDPSKITIKHPLIRTP